MISKYVERGAYHYDWYKDNSFGYRDLVDEVVSFCKGYTLDFGCGDGLVASKLLDKGILAFGIDNDQTALNLCPPELMTVNRDLNIPVQGIWQYLVCLNVIEHLTNPQSVVDTFRDSITTAGIVITDKPAKTLGKYHVHEFSKAELLELFKDFNPVYFDIGNYNGIKIYK